MQLNAITRKAALPAIILLVVILIAATLRYSLSPFEVELADSAFRGRTISPVLATFLFLCCGIVEGKMLPRSGLSKGYCTLPMPLYGILACGIFVAPHILAAATASFCFALALHLLLRSLHNADEKDSVFFASMLLGTMVLLSPPTIILVATIPIAVFVLALSLRQAVLMAVGYLLPLLGASYIVWYKGGKIFDFGRNLYSALALPQLSEVEGTPYLAILLVAAIVAVLLYGVIYAAIRPDKMFLLSRIRRALHLFIWVSLLSLTMILLPGCDLAACAIIAVPTAILLSFVLSILPNNISTIAYWVTLAIFVAHLFVA